jgi:hypothetical protein
MNMKSFFTHVLSRFNVNSNDNYLLNRLNVLEERIVKLEQENIETSNLLYELSNSIDAIDCRIDILTLKEWSDYDV